MLTVISDIKPAKWKTINTRLITLYRYQTFGLIDVFTEQEYHG